MTSLKNVLAIPGSTRKNAANHSLVKAIADLTVNKLSVTLFDAIAGLPHFNPDDAADNVPEAVIQFRQLLNNADGVIICTPEYAHGVPGTLKNAIDWTVSSGEFSHKPVLLITASTDGKSGHHAMLETLCVLEAKNIDELQLLIPFARTKVNSDNKITDEKTLADVKEILEKFIQTISATG